MILLVTLEMSMLIFLPMLEPPCPLLWFLAYYQNWLHLSLVPPTEIGGGTVGAQAPHFFQEP